MQVLNMGKWYITNNNNMSIIIIQHISMNTWIYIAAAHEMNLSYSINRNLLRETRFQMETHDKIS